MTSTLDLNNSEFHSLTKVAGSIAKCTFDVSRRSEHFGVETGRVDEHGAAGAVHRQHVVHRSTCSNTAHDTGIQCASIPHTAQVYSMRLSLK